MRDTPGQNKANWDAMADIWFGTTALPTYGCLIPQKTSCISSRIYPRTHSLFSGGVRV